MGEIEKRHKNGNRKNVSCRSILNRWAMKNAKRNEERNDMETRSTIADTIQAVKGIWTMRVAYVRKCPRVLTWAQRETDFLAGKKSAIPFAVCTHVELRLWSYDH